MIIKPSTPPLVGSKVNLLHPLSRGLVGYWPLNEGAGTGCNDAGPQHLTGKNIGTAVTWVGSPHGTCAKFAGVGGIKTDVHYAVGGFTGNVSQSARFKLTAYPSSGTLYQICGTMYISVSNKWQFGIDIYNNAGTYYLRSVITSQGVTQVNTQWVFTSSTLPLETWFHVVGLVNGTTHKLYLNGVEMASSTSTVTWATITPDVRMCIGCLDGDGVMSRYINGSINHVGYWKRALNQTEVKALTSNPNQIFYKQPIWYTPTDVTTDITQTSTYRIEVTTDKTQSSTWSIYGTTDKTQSLTYRIEVTTDKTQSSVWTIGDTTTDKTQSSTYRIETTTDKTQSSLWSIYGSTDKTQSSTYRIQITRDKDQYSTWAIAGIGTLSLIFIEDIDEAYTPYIIDENFHRVKRHADQTRLLVVPASETVKGLVERATDAEVTTGSDTDRYVSPYHLNAYYRQRGYNCVITLAGGTTTVSATNTYYKCTAGTQTTITRYPNSDSSWTITGNKVQYKGAATRIFKFIVTLGVQDNDAMTSFEYAIQLDKNAVGSPVAYCVNYLYGLGDHNDINTVTFMGVGSMATNDYVELFVSNGTNTDDLNVTEITILIEEIL